jgi:hypothetical protein
MRALCLVSLLLLACRTHTVPIGSMGPRQSATPFAPRTGLRSPAMIGEGAAVIGFNLAVALAWFLVDGTDAGPYVAVTAPLFVVWVGHSAGVGIPLIVLGSRPARLPQAQQPQAPAAQVGAIQVGDVGLRWNLDWIEFALGCRDALVLIQLRYLATCLSVSNNPHRQDAGLCRWPAGRQS